MEPGWDSLGCRFGGKPARPVIRADARGRGCSLVRGAQLSEGFAICGAAEICDSHGALLSRRRHA